jgi:hypothetical protein
VSFEVSMGGLLALVGVDVVALVDVDVVVTSEVVGLASVVDSGLAEESVTTSDVVPGSAGTPSLDRSDAPGPRSAINAYAYPAGRVRLAGAAWMPPITASAAFRSPPLPSTTRRIRSGLGLVVEGERGLLAGVPLSEQHGVGDRPIGSAP